MKTFFKILLFISLGFIIILTTYLNFVLISISSYSLNKDKLTLNDSEITYYDSNNQLIKPTFSNKKGNFVKIEKLNKHTVNAFISIEDKRFYSHNGFDYYRIGGALINNLKSLSLQEGGSTISQQLIKNTHLTNEKTLKRKLAEFKITRELEKEYTKNEILEIYLNTIYFGKGAYGINNASILYFGKTANDLTLNESAVLAGLIKSPSKYSPLSNIENCFTRKNVVLKSMLNNGYIDKEVYEKTKKEKIVLNENTDNNGLNDYVKATNNELEKIFKNNPYKLNGKVKIFTYLDKNLQNEISNVNIDECKNYNSSKIVINSKNGGVIAFFGNNSNLKRNPASTVKPWLIYAPMINDKKICESTIISDTPIKFNDYSPKNYNGIYHGNVDVKTALSKSLNVPAVKLLNVYGIKNANKYSKLLTEDYVCEDLTASLGSSKHGLTLKEICDAYSPFNNDGNFKKSSFIKEIIVNGRTIYKNKSENTNVFTPETSFIINDMLKECVKTGTLKKLRDKNYDLCGKSGTNGDENGNKDAYAITYTTEHIIGVYLGENQSLMPNSVSGGTYPAIYASEILDFLYKNTKPSPFVKPEGIVECKIDKEELFENSIPLISDKDNSLTYYYLNGTQPKKVKQQTLYPKILNAKISQNCGIVKIEFSLKNAIKYEIIKNNIIVFSGVNNDVFIDNLVNFGIYNYKIIAYSSDNKKEVYDFSPIKFDQSSLNIKDDWDKNFY